MKLELWPEGGLPHHPSIRETRVAQLVVVAAAHTQAVHCHAPGHARQRHFRRCRCICKGVAWLKRAEHRPPIRRHVFLCRLCPLRLCHGADVEGGDETVSRVTPPLATVAHVTGEHEALIQRPRALSGGVPGAAGLCPPCFVQRNAAGGKHAPGTIRLARPTGREGCSILQQVGNVRNRLGVRDVIRTGPRLDIVNDVCGGSVGEGACPCHRLGNTARGVVREHRVRVQLGVAQGGLQRRGEEGMHELPGGSSVGRRALCRYDGAGVRIQALPEVNLLLPESIHRHVGCVEETLRRLKVQWLHVTWRTWWRRQVPGGHGQWAISQPAPCVQQTSPQLHAQNAHDGKCEAQQGQHLQQLGDGAEQRRHQHSHARQHSERAQRAQDTQCAQHGDLGHAGDGADQA